MKGKKIIGSFLIGVLIICSFCMVVSAAYLGDVDGDGHVTASDARSVLRHAAKLNTLDDAFLRLADVDGNETITASDARVILRMAANLEALKEDHVHAYTVTEIQKMDCVTNGICEYRCSICGDTFTREYPTTKQHDYIATVMQEADCGRDGLIKYECSVCGTTYTKSVSATGNHDYVSEVTKEVTYNDSGATVYKCSICGHSYTKKIEALKVQYPVYIHLPETPISICYYDYKNNLTRTFQIDEFSYSTRYWQSSDDYALYLSLVGQKTFESAGELYNTTNRIRWKLYDAEGYVVESGILNTETIKLNEKTKLKDEILTVHLDAGEYFLEIMDIG